MKRINIFMTSALLISALFLSACSGKEQSDGYIQTESAPYVSRSASADEIKKDPYSVENVYDVPESCFEKRSDVDYGTVVKDVSYYSETAKDNKECNILLPAGYDETLTYPVMYIIHGFHGSHSDQIDTDSYVVLLYGNMLHDGLTVPMILVNVDMYTDVEKDKDSKTDEELRYIYDKTVDDIEADLMPFIESGYPVKTGRENTAVAGMSEGGAKSLCTGFKWLDKFGYIAGFAPDTNVIPIGENYMDSFWTVPYFPEGFPLPSEDNTPYYVYMAVGDEDPWNIEGTLYYGEVLSDMGVKNQTDLVKGYGHDYIFWRQCFYNYFKKVFRA